MAGKISLSAFLVLFAILITYLFLRNNIHTVVPNQIYRSAQLSVGGFQYLIEKDGIKSIINLRGENTNQSWYQQEIKVAKDLDVKHYDLRWSAYQVTGDKQLQELVHVLETAPRPILVHCMGGSDRAGLASAVALILDNDSLQEAEQQFSLRYLVIHDDSTGKLTLPAYQTWLKKHKLDSSAERFISWLSQQEN